MAEKRHVSKEDDGQKLGRWLKKQYPHMGYSLVEKLLRKGDIRINSSRATYTSTLQGGDEIKVPPQAMHALKQHDAMDIPKEKQEEIRQWVQYKDDDCLVINKPAGLATQGGSKIHNHLDMYLQALCFDKEEKPRLVHRLDKETSGALLLARSLKAAQYLTNLFAHGNIQKEYKSLVIGKPKALEGTINAAIQKAGKEGQQQMVISPQGQHAITHYKVLGSVGSKVSLLCLSPETGRTHQLRVHCAKVLNTPIIGDRKYGFTEEMLQVKIPNRLYLHASRIEWVNPKGKKIVVMVPMDFKFQGACKIIGLDGIKEKV